MVYTKHMEAQNNIFRETFNRPATPEVIRLHASEGDKGVRGLIKVIYRQYNNGVIVAIFPEVCTIQSPAHCLRFMPDMGFGSIDPVVTMKDTTPVTTAEAKGLHEYIEGRGNRLMVCQRLLTGYYLTRVYKMQVMFHEVI